MYCDHDFHISREILKGDYDIIIIYNGHTWGYQLASTDYMLRCVDMVWKDIRRDMIGPIVVHCRYFFESSLYCLFCNAQLFYYRFTTHV